MALAFNGTDAFLEWAGTIRSSLPFSMFCWVRQASSGSSQFPLTLNKSTADTYVALFVNANGGNYHQVNRIAGSSDNLTSNPTTGGWIPWLFTWDGTARKAYCGNYAVQSDAINLTDIMSQLDRITVGAARFNNSSTAQFFFNGSIAEAHFWNMVLTAADFTSLSGGSLPETVESSNYVDGWILKDTSSLTSIGGTRTLTLNGGVTNSGFAHPITRTTAGPNITAQPSNQSVTAPATATFSVTATASGGGTLSCQWQRSTDGGSTWSNWSTGTGATTASFTTPATSVSGGNANNGDKLRVQCTETGGSNPGTVNSNVVTLTVSSGGGRLFRQTPGGQLTGIGTTGPFYGNPLN